LKLKNAAAQLSLHYHAATCLGQQGKRHLKMTMPLESGIALSLSELEKPTMAQNQSKCAHVPCVCVPPAGEEYCNQFSKDAGSKETEIACDCRRPTPAGMGKLANQSPEYHLRRVIQWCDEEIEALIGEMVAQGGSDWHGEFPNPIGLLDNLHETRKTACSILTEIQAHKTKTTWAGLSPISPAGQALAIRH
jgi:hypothetical protein